MRIFKAPQGINNIIPVSLTGKFNDRAAEFDLMQLFPLIQGWGRENRRRRNFPEPCQKALFSPPNHEKSPDLG
jgi:hypothetical protein